MLELKTVEAYFVPKKLDKKEQLESLLQQLAQKKQEKEILINSSREELNKNIQNLQNFFNSYKKTFKIYRVENYDRVKYNVFQSELKKLLESEKTTPRCVVQKTKEFLRLCANVVRDTKSGLEGHDIRIQLVGEQKAQGLLDLYNNELDEGSQPFLNALEELQKPLDEISAEIQILKQKCEQSEPKTRMKTQLDDAFKNALETIWNEAEKKVIALERNKKTNSDLYREACGIRGLCREYKGSIDKFKTKESCADNEKLREYINKEFSTLKNCPPESYGGETIAKIKEIQKAYAENIQALNGLLPDDSLESLFEDDNAPQPPLERQQGAEQKKEKAAIHNNIGERDVRQEICALLKTYKTNRKLNEKEYFYGAFFSYFQKSRTEKINAVRALTSALNGERVDLDQHLSTLRNGRLGKTLRAFIKDKNNEDGIETLLNKKVTTIRAFVGALNDNNPKNAQNQNASR